MEMELLSNFQNFGDNIKYNTFKLTEYIQYYSNKEYVKNSLNLEMGLKYIITRKFGSKVEEIINLLKIM